MPDSNSTESDTPDHGEPIEDSSTSEPEHLPGLGPDEPQSVDPAPRSDAPASASPHEPERYGEGKWTNEELDSWFEGEHGGYAGLEADAESRRRRKSLGLDEAAVDDDLMTILYMLKKLEQTNRVEPGTDRNLSEAFLSGEGQFRNLPPELKSRFRDDLDELKAQHAAAASVDTPETPEASPEVEWAPTAALRTTVTLPDGSTLTETYDQDAPGSPASTELRDRDGHLTTEPETDYEPTDVGTPSTGGIGGFSPRLLMIGGGGILSLLVLGFVLLSGGGDDAVGGDSSSVVAASPAAVSEDACTAVREQEIVLQLSSPDVQPTVPGFFGLSDRHAKDYPTPRLDWSTVPPETTEIVVLFSSPRVDLVDSYRADPLLWWRGESIEVGRSPIGNIRWTLIGIDPTATSLARTSLSSPAPSGTTELFRNGTQTTIDGVDFSNKFLGPSYPGQAYLFTVFALCYPTDDVPDVTLDSYNPTWLQSRSIATGWFFSDAAW